MNRFAALAACALIAAIAAPVGPAFADDDEWEGDGTTFEMKYAFEYQMWGVANSAFGFATPMQMFSVTDRSGNVLALASAASRTVSNRMAAENAARDKAVREGKTSYSYEYALGEAEPHPGLHLGMQLGFGGVNGLTGTPAGSTATGARLFRLNLDSDLAAIGPGTLAWDTAMSLFSVPGTGFESTYFPIGLSYRMAVPVPVLGALLIEPSAHLDYGRVIGSGFKSFAANDVGVLVGYYLDDQWRLDARFQSARLSQKGGLSPNPDDTAGVTTLSLGTSMIF